LTVPAKGYIAFLLHAHLPYVRHNQAPLTLEERWFYEAVTDTYLPLIDMLNRLLEDGIDFKLTISLSPTLLAMMEDQAMQQKTRDHLASLQELAQKEVRRLQHDAAFAITARMYAARFQRLQDLYDRLDGDLIAKLRSLMESGCVELITCAATHAFLPLVKNAEALRAQLEAAVTEFRRHFGVSPAGIWLPECGYTPAVESHLQALGLRCFVVDAHAVGQTTHYAPLRTQGGGCAFVRDPEASTQVWSAESGYPGDPDYREYYRDIGFDLGQEGGAEWAYIKPYVLPDGVRIRTGLKYYRVTGRDTDAKEPYQPEQAALKAQQHAEHFLAARLEQLRLRALDHAAAEDPAVIVCPYDAELFGHWWFEGPQWLEAVLRGLDARSSALQSITLSRYASLYPPKVQAQLSTSSWGRGGTAEVWLGPQNDWVYPLLHKAEDRLLQAVRSYPDPQQLSDVHVRTLNQASREMLLAQSSDWTFMLDAATMQAYAAHRIKEHLEWLHRLLDTLLTLNKTDYKEHMDILEHAEKRTLLFPELSYTFYRSNVILFPPALSGSRHSSKLRILMLAWEYPPRIIGGLARAVCDLSKQLAVLGHEVHVITCHVPDNPIYELDEGVHVHRIPLLQSLQPVSFLDWIFQMNLAFIDAMVKLSTEGLSFDLIHGHDWLVYYAAKQGKNELGAPLAVTIHATEHGRQRGKLTTELQQRIHLLENNLTHAADVVIVCSQAMAEEVCFLFQLPPSRVVHIPNGIDPDLNKYPIHGEVNGLLLQACTLVEEERLLCFLGRLVHEKGIHILIEAMHLIIQRLPNIKLVIAGVGPMQEQLQAQASFLKEYVYFVGFAQEADKIYLLQHAELCIIPSLYEPFGLVALEAMAHELPIVASDIGGLSEIIEHGVDGCKVPPGDPVALAEQIIDLLTHPARSAQLGQRAKQKVHSQYHWSLVALSTSAAYDALLKPSSVCNQK
jgi:1,4-alpha-glucan branching enzyme